jgi:hypothetical protein
MVTPPYTREQHDRAMANLQKILDCGLALLEQHPVQQPNDILSGKSPDGITVEVSCKYIFDTIGWLKIYWGRDYLTIQFKTETHTPSDSTKWGDGNNFLGQGHIQTAYSRERRDTEFSFDLVSLLQTVEQWEILPFTSATVTDKFQARRTIHS